MDLAKLMWARIAAVHQTIGAPIEPFELLAAGDWELWPLGKDGGVGIKPLPERDGDGLVVCLPTDHSRRATVEFLRVMERHLETGRALYSMAWEGHILALNANMRVGGEAMGIDADRYIHFKHTLEGFRKALGRE